MTMHVVKVVLSVVWWDVVVQVHDGPYVRGMTAKSAGGTGFVLSGTCVEVISVANHCTAPLESV